MSSKTWYFTGTAKWAKVETPDPKYGKYSIDLYMDEHNMAKYEESGAQLKIRTNDEGEQYVSFQRPHVMLSKGELVTLGPPDMLSADGSPLPKGTLIGNGSIVTVRTDVFDTQKGKGTRLTGVRVDNLVEYRKREVDEDIDTPF